MVSRLVLLLLFGLNFEVPQVFSHMVFAVSRMSNPRS